MDYVNLYCLELTTLGERSNATNEWTLSVFACLNVRRT